MARRTKTEAEATRNLILDAAERVFREHGVGHTTLVEIAVEAGVTRGAIYWHFENKADLLQAVNDRAHLPFDAINELISDECLDDPLAALRSGAIRAMKQATEDERLRRVIEILLFKCEYVDDMTTMLERRRQKREDCLAAISKNLRLAMDKAQVPVDLDVDSTAMGLYALVEGLLINWLMDPERFDLVWECGRHMDAYLVGLSVPPTSEHG